MIGAGARHLIEEIVVRHRLDQDDGNVLLGERQRQAQADRACADDDDGIGLRHRRPRAAYFCGTTSFTAPAQPLWVRSNTRPVGDLYFAS